MDDKQSTKKSAKQPKKADDEEMDTVEDVEQEDLFNDSGSDAGEASESSDDVKSPPKKRSDTTKRARTTQTKAQKVAKARVTKAKPPPKKRGAKKVVPNVAPFSKLRALMHEQVDAAIDNADELISEATLSQSRRKKLTAQYGSAKAKRTKRLVQTVGINDSVSKTVADYNARCLAKTAKPFTEYAIQMAEQAFLNDMDD